MIEFNLENEFDFLSPAYESLFKEVGQSPFQHPIWLHWLYRGLAPAAGAEAAILVGRWRRDGRLAMLIPLLRRRIRSLRVIEFADLGVSDYAACACGEEALKLAVTSPETAARIRELLKPFDLLRIKNIPDGTPAFERLFGPALRRPMPISAHSVALGGSFEAWRAANLRPSFAKELAKKRRKLERQGVLRLERPHGSEEIRALMRELQILHDKRFANDMLGEPRHFEFYSQVAVDGAASGLARAYRLTFNGRSAGGLWGLAHGGRFLVLVTGMDYEALGRYSIGALGFEELARDCIAQGDTVLDFTIGDEAYKELFGALPAPMWTASIAGTGVGRLAQTLAETKLRPRVRSSVTPTRQQA